MVDNSADNTSNQDNLKSEDADAFQVGITETQRLFEASKITIAALEKALAEMRDKWLRAEAEIANVKVRATKDTEDARQYGIQKFAADVVDGVENLRRGLESNAGPQFEDGQAAKLHDGFAGVERSFVSMLERYGIKRHDPTGEIFDPSNQQAMDSQETSARPPGTVMHAMTSTWTLNGRLLRPALVVVAKKPPPPANTDAKPI